MLAVGVRFLTGILVRFAANITLLIAKKVKGLATS
jgi:hypothetical protein